MSDAPRKLMADRGDAGRRLDLVVRRHLAGDDRATRTRIQAWIHNGQVSINGTPVRRVARHVALGDIVAIVDPVGGDGAGPHDVPKDRAMLPENLCLDVLYEDEYLLVLNKRAGMVVHPAYKNTTGTAMNALL